MILAVKRLALALLFILGAGSGAHALDPENTLYLDLKNGRVTIELLPDVAPKTVAHIKALVRKGFYDGTPIHRVIPGFMAQMGDPTGTGSGGSGETVPAEFSALRHERGVVSMAREPNNINSADSQFFICFAPRPGLDGQYTIFGRVVSGMEFVDKIKAGTEADNGVVLFPDKIVRMTLEKNAE